jgi:hypothetical protein
MVIRNVVARLCLLLIDIGILTCGFGEYCVAGYCMSNTGRQSHHNQLPQLLQNRQTQQMSFAIPTRPTTMTLQKAACSIVTAMEWT